MLVKETQHSVAASGLHITREFDGAGTLRAETHCDGAMRILLERRHREDGAVEETYMVRQRLVSRAAYEKARQQYPEMPPADARTPDIGGELQRAVAAERRQERTRRAKHVVDPARASALDRFCTELLAGKAVSIAREWIRRSGNRLGLRSRSSSIGVIETLSKRGAVGIWVCEVAPLDVASETSDHVVVELPQEPASRRSLLQYASRLAHQQGYEGVPEDGQRFVYIKLA